MTLAATRLDRPAAVNFGVVMRAMRDVDIANRRSEGEATARPPHIEFEGAV
ncbi:MAG TPA: hypothetical protein VMQ61_04635 [Thermoanaerobaculia bacterium]|nr:hypothetical protein [Thermoanaerobaculia bacterium]